MKPYVRARLPTALTQLPSYRIFSLILRNQ